MPSTITVDITGGPHGNMSLPGIPLIDGEAPDYLEYRGVSYRLLAKVPGRQRRLYHMHTVIVKNTTSNGVKTEETEPAAQKPATKPAKKTAKKAVNKEEPAFSG